MGKYYAGIDLGGTKILTGIGDTQGNILARSRVRTEVEKGEEGIIQNIIKSLNRSVEKAAIDFADLSCIGVGSPGPLSISRGVISETSNLPFKEFPLVELLEAEVNKPVLLENDANSAALAEKMFGAGQGVEEMIYITISTGIGGGIISKGEIFHGCCDGAGEIGHMIVNPGGPTCGFNQHRGCLEAMASGTAILREARNLLQQEDFSGFTGFTGEPKDLTGYQVAKLARQGDEKAQEIYEEVGYYLGIGVANLINLFNPELIVFGGGVMKAKELFWDVMRHSIADHAIPAVKNDCQLEESKLGEDVGLVGALAVAINRGK